MLHIIREPIASDLDAFQKHFRRSIKSKVPLLNVITAYLLKSKGKQMRPMLVFLTALLTGRINDKTHRAAALIELLHTATLVHDDVVDEADKRRGFFSINALWKNKAAVLVGDYLLSKGMLIALENKDFDMLEIISGAVAKMSEGELLQMEKARKLNIDEETYMTIIKNKTASLFSACCACGAASARADEKTIKIMTAFGENLGMAFQMKDDLFDYQKFNNTGKPHSNDIKEKKITLPIIYLLKNASGLEKRKYINIIKNHNTHPAKVELLLSKVYESGGIQYAENKMNDYAVKAMTLLNHFEDNDASKSLKKLIKFTIERNK